MNSMGTLFRASVFGESHGPAIGLVLDGVPAGLPIAPEDFLPDIARRRAGAEGSTARSEDDLPEFLSGIFEGRATGTPLCLVFRNGDTRSADYARFTDQARPGHADFVAMARYSGFSDPRGSGHFSGRVTVALVAAGVVAKKILAPAVFETRLLEAGGSSDVAAAVSLALADGDSVGALVELRARGMRAGLGEPFFDSVEGLAARALFAVPGVRGVEFGDGFASARMRGSEHNDPIVDALGATSKNGAGGVNGGVTNGNEIVARVAVKPASSISKEQITYNSASGEMDALSVAGRHDTCIALRSAVALEAALAVALADLELQAR